MVTKNMLMYSVVLGYSYAYTYSYFKILVSFLCILVLTLTLEESEKTSGKFYVIQHFKINCISRNPISEILYWII